MADTGFAPKAAMEGFADAIKPFFRKIGDPDDICARLGMEADAAPLVTATYRGELLPSWRFVEDLMTQVPRTTTRQRQHLLLQHRRAIEAWQTTLHVGYLDLKVDLERKPEVHSFFDPKMGDIRFAQKVSRVALPRPAEPPLVRTIPVEPVSAGVWADAPGYELKPDPMTVHDVDELLERLREFWRWAGRPSMRDLAERSGQAFSKSTVTKLIHKQTLWTTKPPLSQKYVAGIVRGCGGEEQEIARWVTAFRLLDMGKIPADVRPDGTVTELRRPTGSQRSR